MSEKADIFSKLKSFAGPAMRGLSRQFAPQVAQGFIVEYFGQIPLEDIVGLVKKDSSLWDQVAPEQKVRLKELAADIGGVDWLTAEWAIDAFRKPLPAYASLFLGWKKARNWLERQVKEIQEQIRA